MPKLMSSTLSPTQPNWESKANQILGYEGIAISVIALKPLVAVMPLSLNPKPCIRDIYNMNPGRWRYDYRDLHGTAAHELTTVPGV